MKMILCSAILLLSLCSIGQTTATNFTVNNCSGTSFNLFDQLDNGNVVVIAWVMPCSGCISSSVAANDAANSFSTSHAGKVKYLLVDDYANTNCVTLTNWASTNEITNVAGFFSNAAIDMSDYGSDGMPKIVVVGCNNHKIYLNKNNTVTYDNVKSAIQEALNATECNTVGLNDVDLTNLEVEIFPNPTNQTLIVKSHIQDDSEATVELFNELGKLILSEKANVVQGILDLSIDVHSFNSGIYFVKISTSHGIQTKRLFVKTS